MVLPREDREESRLTPPEERLLRSLVDEQIRDSGEKNLSFRSWYTVLEKAVLSPVSRLTWWPPTNEMRAMIENS